MGVNSSVGTVGDTLRQHQCPAALLLPWEALYPDAEHGGTVLLSYAGI